MSNNKQSSIDKFIEAIMKHDKSFKEFYGAEIAEAKAMHKEEMFEYTKQKYWLGEHSLEFHKEIFEKWYNETYGGNKWALT